MRNPFRPPSAKIPRQPTCLVFIKRTSFSMTNTIIANQPQEWANLPDLVALLPNLVIGCKAIRYDTMCIAAIFHYAWKQRMQCAARTCNFREIVLSQPPLKFCPLAGLCEVFMSCSMVQAQRCAFASACVSKTAVYFLTNLRYNIESRLHVPAAPLLPMIRNI